MTKPTVVVLGIKYIPSIGGTSRVAEHLINLLKKDFNIILYCYKNSKAKEHLKDVKLIQIPKIPLGTLGVFIYYLLCALHTRLFVKYDLAHIHKTDASFITYLLSKKKPIINTSHEAPYLRDKWSGISKAYFKLMEKAFIKSSAIKTCISKPLTEIYNEKYNTEVQYFPNGVNKITQYNYAAADEILNKHNISGDFVFFAARRIMSTKGAHTMLKGLKEAGWNKPIVIAGDSSQLPNYIKELDKLSKGLDVKFIGFINNVETLMALIDRSKYFIFPSETEGMSIMLLEVASVGTPIIASDIKENTAVFNPDELCFFKNKDASDLATRFKWAINHEEELNTMALKAKTKVESQYSWNQIYLNYKDFYDLHLCS